MTNGVRQRPSWREGNAATEFAMISPLLILLMMGVVDYGLKMYYLAELQRSVRAGAQYATATGHATDQVGISTTIQQASNLTGISVNPLVDACYCAGGASIACTGSTCADGSSVGNYVTISATYSYTPFLHYFTSGAWTLTSNMTIRTS